MVLDELKKIDTCQFCNSKETSWSESSDIYTLHCDICSYMLCYDELNNANI